ncbi:MAG: Uma2 family endonuclease [Isosphaeraceae bacterium]|nr:Uma2 family endonuclease [Isosphaeraceae bacterium]
MAISTQPTEPAGEARDEIIPPLENGDRLSRAEFERRYDAMPGLKKAELIEGEVYIPSPVRHRRHSHPHARVVGWLAAYETDTPGVEAGDNGSVRLDLDNEPQPDAYLIIRPESGGQALISGDDYIEGAPELIAEVVSSSASYDLGKKLNSYRRNGVSEYVVWRVVDRQVDWLVNRGGQFERLSPATDGILRSTVFPGLWLHPAALIEGDKPTVKAVLQEGLRSAEHAAFVARLERTGRV